MNYIKCYKLNSSYVLIIFIINIFFLFSFVYQNFLIKKEYISFLFFRNLLQLKQFFMNYLILSEINFSQF